MTPRPPTGSSPRRLLPLSARASAATRSQRSYWPGWLSTSPCQGEGLGARLLLHALGELLKVSRSVGFEVVVVHAIDEPAATFYARFGFEPFADHPLHLFMPLKHLTATFDA